jgi:uncharacterized RDD family membrane protein YckC
MLCPKCGKASADQDKVALCSDCTHLAEVVLQQQVILKESSLPKVSNPEFIADSEVQNDEIENIPIANFGLRVSAFFLDTWIASILILFFIILVNKIFSNIVFDLAFSKFVLDQKNPISFQLSLSTLLSLMIVPYLESVFGGTPGKLLMGLRVVTFEGNRISFLSAAIRHIIRLVSVLTFYLGFLPVLFTKNTQSAHDYLTDTLVIKKKKVRILIILFFLLSSYLINNHLGKVFNKNIYEYYVLHRSEIDSKTTMFKNETKPFTNSSQSNSMAQTMPINRPESFLKRSLTEFEKQIVTYRERRK